MIHFLEGFPDDVLAFAATGHLTAHDFRAVVRPAVKAKLGKHARIGLYYRLGPGFSGMSPGAILEDAVTDLSHWRAWRRIALVTDIKWLRLTLGKLVPVFHRRVRFFSFEQEKAARDWVSGGGAEHRLVSSP